MRTFQTIASLFLIVLCAPALAGDPVLRFSTDDLVSHEIGASVEADVVLPGGSVVTLELRRFGVTRPDTRLVLGKRNGPDTPIAFDPAEVVLLRGEIRGDPQSRVFLGSWAGEMTGSITLGAGERFRVTSRDARGRLLDPGVARVVTDAGAGGSVPACGVDSCGHVHHDDVEPGSVANPADFYLVEVAVETDYELYEQFFDLDAELAHVVITYGAISDIYIRDVGTALTLTYVRLWDQPDDLFNIEDPLREFRDYWNENMTDVHRDLAQFLSGRVNFWYGGVAFGSSVCNDGAYSVSGYTLGYIGDFDGPNVYNRDIHIPAHEIGHNLGTGHTHSYGLDTCQDPSTLSQRGSIMAYCGQSFTGGDANHDLRFHTVTAARMRDLMSRRECVARDCNLNGIADDEDIAGGSSADVNANGVPDECEDCNANGVFDLDEIASGASTDINANGVPDECEPDCNANGIPDDWDIAEGLSLDAHGDGVPDECEADRNGDGVSDYTEICIDMSLDLDRDAILDASEDCDDDGVIDLIDMGGANDIWVADLHRTSLRRFLSVTGTVVSDSDDADLHDVSDVLTLSGGRVLAATMSPSRVAEFDALGTYVGDLIPSGEGGLSRPGAMLVSPWGALLVASQGTDSVKAFDPQTGTYLGDLVTEGSGGLISPFGLTIAPSGTLLVTSDDGRVLEYDAGTGVFLREVISVDQNAGLDDPRGLLALADGSMLVASRETNQVLEFDVETGGFVRQFNRGGTEDRLSLDQPWCIRLGPDGHVYVSRAHDHGRPPPPPLHDAGSGALHLTNASVYQFERTSGKLIRAYVQSLESGLEHATGFDFLSGGKDCNLNLVPDSCDIASGESTDANADGIPDECQADCVADHDDNGVVDSRDLVTLLADFSARRPAADIDGNDVVDSRDVLAFLGLWQAGC